MENDTLVAITGPQLIKINRSLNDYIHLKKINRNLQMDLSVSDSVCTYWRNIAVKTDTLCLIETEKYNEALRINETLQVSLANEKKKAVKMGIGVGVGGTILGILLGVLLGNK